jgi:hypothetical protein
MNTVSYKINIKNIDREIINTFETNLQKTFNMVFIAYDQFELIISFNRKLSDEEEEHLMKLIDIYLYKF